jgi:hypothetical protein
MWANSVIGKVGTGALGQARLTEHYRQADRAA